jgi:hypothetical protein
MVTNVSQKTATSIFSIAQHFNYPEDKGSRILQDICNYLPIDTASHARRLGPSSTLLEEHHI